MKKTVPEILRDSARIYEDRSASYGENYKVFGELFFHLLEGIQIRNTDDVNRIGILIQILSKLSRYMNNWAKNGHRDSLQDLITYVAMLQELDEEISNRQLELPLGGES